MFEYSVCAFVFYGIYLVAMKIKQRRKPKYTNPLFNLPVEAKGGKCAK